MKKQTTLTLVAVFAAIAAITVRSQGWADKANEISQKQSPPLPPAVVVLSGYENWIPGQPYGHYDGFVVETSASSINAPVFKPGENLAQVLATLREQGFQITTHATYLTYTAIR